jgi:hypothetical protein
MGKGLVLAVHAELLQSGGAGVGEDGAYEVDLTLFQAGRVQVLARVAAPVLEQRELPQDGAAVERSEYRSEAAPTWRANKDDAISVS